LENADLTQWGVIAPKVQGEETMKIAVATPMGHVGRAVAEFLLDAGADVMLLTRHPEKVTRQVTRGAGVAEGSLDDEEYVIQATRGAEALFWVTPPDFTSSDFRGFQNRVGCAAAEAIRTNRISRVVNLSSVGAHLRSGGGPINGLHDVEQCLDHVATNIIHLRPGYFFENYLLQVQNIVTEGEIYLPVSGSRRVPMIGTMDIARVAADRLVDTSWFGRSIRGLHGPCDMTFNEAASALSSGLGCPVSHVRIEEGPARKAMIGWGMSESACTLMLEMYRGFELGTLRPDEQRSPETYTPTRLTDFAREQMSPLIEELVVR
jgi:uncharacterized protein YbjT (DUF2867 family)